MTITKNFISLFISTLLVAACSGGGGSGTVGLVELGDDDFGGFPDGQKETPYDGTWSTECTESGGESSFIQAKIGFAPKFEKENFKNPICLGSSVNEVNMLKVDGHLKSRVDVQQGFAFIDFYVRSTETNENWNVHSEEPLMFEIEEVFRYRGELSGNLLKLTAESHFFTKEGKVEKTISGFKGSQVITLSNADPKPVERNMADIPAASTVKSAFKKAECTNQGTAVKVYVATFFDPDAQNCHSCLLSENIAVFGNGTQSVNVVHFNRKVKPYQIKDSDGNLVWHDEMGLKMSLNPSWSYQADGLWIGNSGNLSGGSELSFYSADWKESSSLRLMTIHDENVLAFAGCKE